MLQGSLHIPAKFTQESRKYPGSDLRRCCRSASFQPAPAVNADKGDRVKADDVLIAIADAELRANLSAAEARLRMEEINWAHQEKLAARVRSLGEQATVSADSCIRGERVAVIPLAVV